MIKLINNLKFKTFLSRFTPQIVTRVVPVTNPMFIINEFNKLNILFLHIEHRYTLNCIVYDIYGKLYIKHDPITKNSVLRRIDYLEKGIEEERLNEIIRKIIPIIIQKYETVVSYNTIPFACVTNQILGNIMNNPINILEEMNMKFEKENTVGFNKV